MSATYECSTPAAALDQLRYFERKDYLTLMITAPDGSVLTAAELADLAANGAILEVATSTVAAPV